MTYLAVILILIFAFAPLCIALVAGALLLARHSKKVPRKGYGRLGAAPIMRLIRKWLGLPGYLSTCVEEFLRTVRNRLEKPGKSSASAAKRVEYLNGTLHAAPLFGAACFALLAWHRYLSPVVVPFSLVLMVIVWRRYAWQARVLGSPHRERRTLMLAAGRGGAKRRK